MKLAKKIGFSLFALIAISPVLSEIPTMWKWAGDIASKQFTRDQSGYSSSQASIQIWGRPGCGYTNRLVKSLDEWKFPYTYHDINQQMPSYVSEDMSKTVQKSGFKGNYTLPVVKVDDIAIVGNPATMDDVVKALADQDKLPFQYIIYRLGIRVFVILFLETILFLYCWLAFVVFRLAAGKRKSLSAKGK
jgi:glutaredoxin